MKKGNFISGPSKNMSIGSGKSFAGADQSSSGTHKTFSGAGVLLISGSTFLLLENKYDHTFDIPGGTLDGRESVEQTASRELYEETRGIVKLTPEQLARLPHVDLLNRNGKYFRAYIYRMGDSKGICTRFNNTDTRLMGAAFNEHKSMRRFNIDTFKMYLTAYPQPETYPAEAGSPNRTHDKPVSKRAIRVISEAVKNGYI